MSQETTATFAEKIDQWCADFNIHATTILKANNEKYQNIENGPIKAILLSVNSNQFEESITATGIFKNSETQPEQQIELLKVALKKEARENTPKDHLYLKTYLIDREKWRNDMEYNMLEYHANKLKTIFAEEQITNIVKWIQNRVTHQSHPGNIPFLYMWKI